LTEKQSWLYSTPNPQEITIKCENEKEDKIILNKTGKLSVNKKCTIVTSHVTLRTQKAIATKESQTCVSTFNLTLEYKSSNEIKSEEKIANKTKLKQVIKDLLELTKLSLNVEEISDNLEIEENNIFRNKYFVYSVGSGTLVIIQYHRHNNLEN